VRVVSRRARDGGFTLLEVLVVVVIIAVLTTLAVLSVGVLGIDRELDAEGDRFTDVAAAGIEQAQLEGRDYGIWFGPGRYEVLSYAQRRQRWESVADDRLYESHALPAGLTVRLELEGRPAPIGNDKPGTPRVPQVLLFSSGDASPYRLTLGREGSQAQWIVDGQADGTLLVTRPGAQP
jgi:general secretion pathway protein H